MKVTTYEATVENGQVKLPESVRLPEHALVYVLLPGLEENSTIHSRSPRLKHPEQAAEFVMVVTEEKPDATL